MALKETIQSDFVSAMKAKDVIAVSAFRMLKAAILKWEVEGSKREAQDEDIVSLIVKEVKQRKDATEQFRLGHREDLAEKEEKEIVVLQKYLPEQMSEDAVRTVVMAAIEEIHAQSKADMGRVMGIVMPKVKGKADAMVVRTMVEACLH